MSPATGPLCHARILVTRSQAQAPELCAKLEALGASVCSVPVTVIEPPDDWTAVDKALNSLDQYDWLVFASSNAVHFFVARAKERDKLTQLRRSALSAIGPSTASALAQNGLIARFVPSKSIAEQFVIEFPDHVKLKGKTVLWPRGNLGRSLIADALTEAGAKVHIVECYRNTPPEQQHATAQQLAQLIREEKLTHILFASTQAALNFVTLSCLGLSGAASSGAIEQASQQFPQLINYLRHVIIASIGPATSNCCRQTLGKVDIEAQEHSIDGLIDAIVRAAQS